MAIYNARSSKVAVAVAVLLVVVAARVPTAALAGLVNCAPYVVPGVSSGQPSKHHDCACSTLGIISKLPAKCGRSPVACCEFRTGLGQAVPARYGPRASS
ncbi:Protein 108 [Ananas comosus]|uniref:Protein 108 n=1 Tax=Ananas comosus TaxID=4615 RepID=A0A199UIV8_ANACO|nr:Protein 108 [Ananas comosus]